MSPITECGIWLAPSAIEGAGLGMYAGRNFRKKEFLQRTGDCVIPIVDKALHNQESDFVFLWDEYIWSGHVVRTDVEGYEEGDGASPGFGSAANSFLPLVNVEEGTPKKNADGVHRSTSPGAGAFTIYFDRSSSATRDIAAGEELYVNYGAHWFEGRDYMGPVPLFDDLDRATDLFWEFETLKEEIGTETDSTTLKAVELLWDTFVRNTTFVDSRVLGSFRHHDPNELQELKRFDTLTDLRRHQATKSTEWLNEFGTCGDHIFGNTSTLEHAGRGAFASRDLAKGIILAQLPLIHITNRSRLDMYYFDNYETLGRNARRLGPRPPQLLLNYCYGHNESTLLLCPYGPAVNYINHNKTRANVKLQWGDPKRGNFKPSLLNDTLESLEADSTAKLAFELVTLRKIAEGEEIFLDYGDEWERAWQAHVDSWKPVEQAEDYVSLEIFRWQSHLRKSHHLQTVFELIETPYPPNLKLECSEYIRSEDRERNPNYDEYDWFECEILRRTQTNLGIVQFAVVSTKEPYEVFDELPEAAIRLYEPPYTSDLFLPNAFRHSLGIPDEIFPDAWRNAAKKDGVPGRQN